jgi:hypothetical protein
MGGAQRARVALPCGVHLGVEGHCPAGGVPDAVRKARLIRAVQRHRHSRRAVAVATDRRGPPEAGDDDERAAGARVSHGLRSRASRQDRDVGTEAGRRKPLGEWLDLREYWREE